MGIENVGVIWVCTDCLFAHHDALEDLETDREPWALLKLGQHVTQGIIAADHHPMCSESDREEGCYCEFMAFSNSSCEGCGSSLAGDRAAFTLWSET